MSKSRVKVEVLATFIFYDGADIVVNPVQGGAQVIKVRLVSGSYNDKNGRLLLSHGILLSPEVWSYEFNLLFNRGSLVIFFRPLTYKLYERPHSTLLKCKPAEGVSPEA